MATAVSFYEEDFRLWNPRRDARGSTEGIFRVELPLFQWSLAAAAKLFGTHPNQIGRIGAYAAFLLAVAGCWAFLRSYFPPQVATLGVVGFLWSPALFYYSVSPMPDVLALALSLCGLALWRKGYSLLGSLTFSLGSAVKLPFLLLWALPTAEAFFSSTPRQKLLRLVAYAPLVLLFPGLWYGLASTIWQDRGLTQGLFAHSFSLGSYLYLLYHHFVSLLPETILGYALVVPFLRGLVSLAQPRQKPFWILGATLALYTLYEMPTLGYVHDYYLLPWTVWLGIATTAAFSVWLERRKWAVLPLVFTTLAPVGTWARMHHRWDPSRPGFNPDLLGYKKLLQAAVPDTARVVVGLDESCFIYLYHLHKKGWCIDSLHRASTLLQKALRYGAQYLYTGDRELDSIARPFVEENLSSWGSIRLYRLRKGDVFEASGPMDFRPSELD